MGDFIYKYTNEDKIKMCKYFHSQGMNEKDIGMIFDCTEKEISEFISTKSRKKKYPIEVYVEIEKQFLLGMSVKEISLYLDISYNVVYKYLQQKNFIQKKQN